MDQALTGSTVDFLLNLGFDRELVMHATIAAIDVETNERRKFRVYNDPTNDRPDASTGIDCGRFEGDAIIKTGGKEQFNSCLYSKFRYMLLSALKYGVATRATEIKPLKDKEKDRKFEVKLCFEPALVHSQKEVISFRAEPSCDDLHTSSRDSLVFPGHPVIRSAVPIFRSTYGVFQYLGSIIRGTEEGHGTRERAKIIQGEKEVEKQIFPYQSGTIGCFAAAEDYCVTNDPHNGNGRQLIALLNALVALNVGPQALPITPSVQLSPGSR